MYYEPFYVHYNPAELYIANNYSQNKVFYVRWIHGRGSGIFHDAYHFYKLINNRVYPCLVLLNEARIYGWGLMLNQDIKADFKFNSVNTDELWVSYDYNFFPGPIYKEDFDWESHDDISLLQGSFGIGYIWDNVEKQYISNDPQDFLKRKKEACFSDFGNDELFIKAFDSEIKKTLESGTEEQKKILKWYLEIMNNKE